jgi:multiple antibiotic resistance protein
MPAPPITIYWEDLEPGSTMELGSVTPTAQEIMHFARQFDPQPFHLDEAAGKASIFGGLCASGWHTCSLAMRLMVDNFLCRAASMGSPGLETLKWLKPVYPGDTLSLRHTIVESRPLRKRADVGLVQTVWEMFNQDGDKVLHMEGYGMFQRRTPDPTVAGTGGLMDFKPLITLLAIVNPLAIVPFFIHYTQGFSRAQRRRTIWTASFSAFVVIATSALAGLRILEFFGISLASFQVGGGMLLLISSLNMLNAQPAEAKPHTNEMEEGAEKAAMGASIAVVPLTIPLLTGPATMSTVVIYAEKAKTFWQLGTLVGYGIVIGLATALCFALAQPIARVLGKTGINVMTRLMGLILAALAVEVMADGLVKLFPALSR